MWIAGLLLALPSAAAPRAPITGRLVDREQRPVWRAVVLLDGGASATGADGARPAATGEARLEQYLTSFVPKVQVLAVGSALTLANRDDDSHTVHAYRDGRTLFQVATVADAGTAPQRVTLDAPGVIDVRCDIHPEMRATLVVTRSRHHAVTGEEGDFTIADVPAGRYQVRVVSPITAAVAARGEAEPGDLVATIDLGATTPPLALQLPPSRPAAAIADGADARGPLDPAAGGEPWPRPPWSWIGAAIAVLLGLAIAYATARAFARRGASRVGALLLNCAFAGLAGALVIVGLHAAVAAALGGGIFIGGVVFAAGEPGD